MDITLRDKEDNYAPPMLPVLKVQLVGTELFLTIATQVETNKSVTHETIAEVCVDLDDFTAAMTALVRHKGLNFIDNTWKSHAK